MVQDRFYIIVRDDLPPGLQAAQAVHAALAFFHKHPVSIGRWLLASNFLVIVSTPNEETLLDLITEAHTRGIAHVGVREPDVNDEVTAVALAPGTAARQLCANMPLALREVSMST
jgi:peptidyl-tRNA hydrolase